MKELFITEKQLNQFKLIIDTYKNTTKYPKPNNWKTLSNTEIWYWMVGQVIVVGSAGGGKRFWQSPELKKEIALETLLKKGSNRVIRNSIHYVLREAGTRYASSDPEKCAKTKALHANFKFVKAYKNGFKDLLKLLHNMKGRNRELRRVYFLMDNLEFMKNKSARDFLMNLGMNQNTLAIDIRFMNIFQHLKIPFPQQAALGNRKVYETTEEYVRKDICQPLSIKPLYFDRILYQNYFRILRDDFFQLKLNL